ncbi:aldehyde dehydrogenase family protein [Amaricoccus solimangrovi]|uniref:aldehyde dehydrogenase family protein n=1 Tax=Amaricoccus solimangrovi TaxID=2589815 RepID=UPI001AEF314B
MHQAARAIAPTLATGNTAVAKPSEFTTGSRLTSGRATSAAFTASRPDSTRGGSW